MVKDIDFTKYIVPQEITENGFTIRDKVSILENCESKNILARKNLSNFDRSFHTQYSLAYRLRQEYDDSSTKIVSNGFVPINRSAKVSDTNYSFCPTLTIELPFKVGSLKGRSIFGKIEQVKFKYVDIVYHTINFGAYPQSEVKGKEREELEKRYEAKDTRIFQTGKLYTVIIDIDKKSGQPIILRLPEYEYKGQRYVIDDRAQILFFKVEPLKFRIYDMTTSEIKNAKKLNLVCDSLFTGLPYYPNNLHPNCANWQNSMIRAYVNSAKSIELEKDPRFTAPLGWDFSTYGLFYEAFNQAREPIKEVTFEDEKIPCAALYHCDKIEKVNIMPSVKYIDSFAFKGWSIFSKLKKIDIPASVIDVECGNFDTCTQIRFENISNIVNCEDLQYDWNGFKFVYIAKNGSDVIFSKYEDDSLKEDYIEQEGGSLGRVKEIYKLYNASKQQNGKVNSQVSKPKPSQSKKKNNNKNISNINGNGLYEELE